MNAFWLLVMCWSHCILTQPLELAQHTALMNVYDALGSSHVMMSSCRRFTFCFSSRMQQRDSVPAIHCDVKLCWLGVGLFWWQCHAVVRSRERCVVGLSDPCSPCRVMNGLQLTGSILSTIGQLTALAYLYLFALTFQSRAHASGFAHRDLSNNQLTNSIPTTIGELTALTVLYVFVLTLKCRSSRFWLRTGACSATI
jgi:hypothetical protein